MMGAEPTTTRLANQRLALQEVRSMLAVALCVVGLLWVVCVALVILALPGIGLLALVGIL